MNTGSTRLRNQLTKGIKHMMNDSEIQPPSSHPSLETVRAQFKASRGNMGEKSPVIPDSWRGRPETDESFSLEDLRNSLRRPPAANT